MTLIEAKSLKFSNLNKSFLTKSKVILASAFWAMAIFHTNGISIDLFRITKRHSCCFVIVKNSSLYEI